MPELDENRCSSLLAQYNGVVSLSSSRNRCNFARYTGRHLRVERRNAAGPEGQAHILFRRLAQLRRPLQLAQHAGDNGIAGCGSCGTGCGGVGAVVR